MSFTYSRASRVVLVVKNPPANAGDKSLIPGSGRSPGGAGQPTPVFLPGESPWTEEPGRLQSMGSHRVGHDWSHLARTQIHIVTCTALSSLMSFDNCTLPFNHLSKQDVEHWITQRVPSLPFPASSSWLGETTLQQPSFTIDYFCPSLTSIQMFTQWVFFGVCLLLLSITILRFTHIVALSTVPSLLPSSVSAHRWTQTCLPILFPMHMQVFSSFGCNEQSC